MKVFSVTFETVTPESAEQGDVEEQGFVCQQVDLREAFEEIGNTAMEHDGSMRWFTNYEYGNGTRAYYEQGLEESRSLHLPDSTTNASRIRIARLLGVTQ